MYKCQVSIDAKNGDNQLEMNLRRPVTSVRMPRGNATVCDEIQFLVVIKITQRAQNENDIFFLYYI